MSDLPKKCYDMAQRFEGGDPYGLLVRAGDTIGKLEAENEYLKRERAMLVDLRYELKGIAADVDAGNEFDAVCRRTLGRVIVTLSNSEPQATQWLEEKKAEVLEVFATKWLPNMKHRDQQSSASQTTHNMAVDDCIKHALSMANELRLAASKRKEQV